ncbi:MAG: hypothetical protein AABY22_11185, partial [Nanoarchaeota archaeon]
MTFFILSNDEKGRLQQLKQDKSTVLALKKLCVNLCTDKSSPNDVQVMAAERAALDIFKRLFHYVDSVEAQNDQDDITLNLI